MTFNPVASMILGANGGPSFSGWYILLFIAIIIGIVILAIFAQFFTLWIQALTSRANVTMGDLIGMKLRKVNARTIVESKIRSVKAGLDATTADLETHYLLSLIHI